MISPTELNDKLRTNSIISLLQEADEPAAESEMREKMVPSGKTQQRGSPLCIVQLLQNTGGGI